MWDEVVEKAVDIEAKANLQPPFGTKKIDSRYLKGYRPSVKKDKNNAYWEHHNKVFNKDKDKAKSHNSSSANQPQTQIPQKNKSSCRGGHLATEVNVTKVAKKDKDKTKDLGHVECYTYKQKGYYTNKCLKKSKN